MRLLGDELAQQGDVAEAGLVEGLPVEAPLSELVALREGLLLLARAGLEVRVLTLRVQAQGGDLGCSAEMKPIGL